MSQADRSGFSRLKCPSAGADAQVQGAGGKAGDRAFDAAVRKELTRRIEEFASYPETVFGPLSMRDFFITLILFVVVPLLLVWGHR